ncbi:hypothetical protein J6590_045223 [Homalodisca vitripennis]|nr:hypothetical protein J6590_045223 [Homalodisca vitripennis]
MRVVGPDSDDNQGDLRPVRLDLATICHWALCSRPITPPSAIDFRSSHVIAYAGERCDTLRGGGAVECTECSRRAVKAALFMYKRSAASKGERLWHSTRVLYDYNSLLTITVPPDYNSAPDYNSPPDYNSTS